MLTKEVLIGGVYRMKVSGRWCLVQVMKKHQLGGWIGVNEASGRDVRIKFAMDLMMPEEEARAEQKDAAALHASGRLDVAAVDVAAVDVDAVVELDEATQIDVLEASRDAMGDECDAGATDDAAGSVAQPSDDVEITGGALGAVWLKEACSSYVEHQRKAGQKASTLGTIQRTLALLMEEMGEEKEVGKILPVHVDKFFKSERATMQPMKGGLKPRAQASVLQIRRITRMALVWWKEVGFTERLAIPGDEKKFAEKAEKRAAERAVAKTEA